MADAETRVIVPVAEVAAEAYRAVFGRLGLLLDLAWLPLLIMLAAALLPGYLHFYLGWNGLPRWHNDAVSFNTEDLIQALAGLLCLNAFAVRWHQAMLFPGERATPGGIFLGAWARFLFYTLLLYLVSACLLAALLFADAETAPTYVAPVAGLLATLVWVGAMRCCLLFPAAAVGKPLGIAPAWRAMRGNSWRLLGCGFIACTPVLLILVLILSGVFTALHLDQLSDNMPLGFFILRGVIETCTNFVVVALGAAVLSSFYRRIMPRAF
jgi:hypothetical protein